MEIKWKPYNTILKNHGLEEDGKANKFLRDEVDRLSDPYIPRDIGNLARLKTYPNNHSIRYTSKYAQVQYNGKLMLTKNVSSYAKLGERKVLTSTDLKYQGAPKRGPKWDKRMWLDKGKSICKDVERYVKDG